MSKTITGTWLYSNGLPVVSGILYLTLSQDSVVIGTGQVAPSTYAITLNASGQIPGSTTIFANDELSPSGTIYQATVIAVGGARVWGEQRLSITGVSPVNINNLIPLTTPGLVTYGTVPFTYLLSGTNIAAAMVVGTGASLTRSGSGSIDASLLLGNTWSAPGTIGGTTPGLITGTTITATVGFTGNLTGNASGSAGSVNFSGVASGTNTNALVIGTGGTLGVDGTGQIDATSLLGQTWDVPGAIGNGTPGSGAFTTLTSTGLFTNYNGIATVSNGVPAEYATVDLTAQGAAIGTTTLYAVPASGAGQYRVSWNSKVTTPATTGAATSTLGGLTIVYTDPDAVVQTITAAAQIAAGTIATSSTGNTTTTVLLGLPLLLNAKESTNITYAMSYASDAAGEMKYNLHIKLEKL